MTAHCSQHDLSACDARLTRPFFGNGILKRPSGDPISCRISSSRTLP
jgi:hypothetical protein